MSGGPDGEGTRLDVAGDFGGFEGRAWLNCAHQGPLPQAAVQAAERALADVPWLPLAERGVRVRLLRPEGGVLEAGQLAAELGAATRLFCCSWVFSFTGHAVDLAALGQVCRRAGVRFVVNGSQGVAAIPLRLDGLGVDALVSCGFKWLCGPYGTGFCWLHPDLAASLTYRPAYWLAHLAQDDLGQDTGYRLREEVGSAGWDVFGTANFLTFEPWTVSVEYLLGLGVERVAAWDQRLVERFLQGLDPDRYGLVSPGQGTARSALVVFGDHRPERNRVLFERLAAAGVDVAFRRGRLRVSPHLYNTEADIDRALEVLA